MWRQLLKNAIIVKHKQAINNKKISTYSIGGNPCIKDDSLTLHTDLYQINMMQVYFNQGIHNKRPF